MGLIIRSSAIHAAGCYTTAPIASGTRVVEYTGPRITKELADEKYRDSPTTYLFGIGDGSMVIDGHGAAMFINHSCDPNCETDEQNERVWILAIRDIEEGEELTYDYNLYDGDKRDAYCNCGAKTCRRTMYSLQEIRRQKRALRAASAKKKAKGEKRAAAKTASTKPADKRPTAKKAGKKQAGKPKSRQT
jgi:hypothetical protein